MATKTKSVEEPEVVTTSADEPIVVDEPGETPATEAPDANNEPEEPETGEQTNTDNTEPETGDEPIKEGEGFTTDVKELQAKRIITHVTGPEKLTKENLVKYVTKVYPASEIAKQL